MSSHDVVGEDDFVLVFAEDDDLHNPFSELNQISGKNGADPAKAPAAAPEQASASAHALPEASKTQPQHVPDLETIDEAFTRAAAAEAQLQEAQSRLAVATAALAHTRATASRTQSSNATAQEALNQAQADAVKLQAKLARVVAGNTALHAQIQEASTRGNVAVERLDAAQAEVQQRQMLVEQLQSQLEMVKANAEDLEEQVASRQAQCDAHTAQLEQLATREAGLAATIVANTDKLEALAADATRIDEQRREAKKRYEKVYATFVSESERVRLVGQKLSGRKKLLVQLEEHCRSVEEKTRSIKSRLKGLRSNLHQMRQRSHQLPEGGALASRRRVTRASGDREDKEGLMGSQQAMVELLRAINMLSKSGAVPQSTCSTLKQLVFDVTCRG